MDRVGSRGDGIHLLPHLETDQTYEDEPYNRWFTTTGDNLSSSHMETDADWLSWDEGALSLYGTPSDADVGSCWVSLRAISENGHSDDINFTIVVMNINPRIITTDVTYVQADTQYLVNYDSDEPDKDVTWSLSTNAMFLSINASTGLLEGFPKNDDENYYEVGVTVKDRNGGWAGHNFGLIVGKTPVAPVLFVILSPTPGSEVRNKVKVDLELNEDWGKVIEILCHIDRNYRWVENIPEGYNNLTLDALGPGEHTVELIAKSDLGYWGQSSVTFLVVNTPPMLYISSPKQGTYVKGNITVEGNVTDPDQRITDLIIMVNGTIKAYAHFLSNSAWDAKIPTGSFPPGLLRIEAVARDSTGAVSSFTVNVTRMKDITPPKVTILAPSSGTVTNGNFSMTIAVDYSEPSVLRLEFVDVCNITDMNVTRGEWTVNVSDCSESNHQFAYANRVMVKDRWNQSSDDMITLIHKGQNLDENPDQGKDDKKGLLPFEWRDAYTYDICAVFMFLTVAGIHYYLYRKDKRTKKKTSKGRPPKRRPVKHSDAVMKGYWTWKKGIVYVIGFILLFGSMSTCGLLDENRRQQEAQSEQMDQPIIVAANIHRPR